MAALRLNTQQNVEIHLIARKWEAIQGIEFHRCNPWHLDRVSRDFSFALAACRLANKLKPDLVQSHERLSCCDIYRAGDGVHREWLKQRGRVLNRWQRWLMHANPYHLYIQWAERRIFESRRLKAVICNSLMVKNEILSHFQIDADKIHLIRNGIDTKSFHPDLRQQRAELREKWQLPEHAPVFLFVGSGFERKGLTQTMLAMCEAKEAHLLVVGHDKHQKRYQDAAERIGLNSRIHFIGPQKDTKPFYALADAFILPTLYDPFSNAVLEAMSCGLPVITSTKSGAAEILLEEESGFVCDALNNKSIAKAIQTLTDQKLAQDMGSKARSLAEKLDWSVIGGELFSLYTKLTNNNPNQ